MRPPCLQQLRLATALCLVLVCHSAWAAPCDRIRGESDDSPRIGLVLGGGGARGAAHVGVLKVLEELQVPIDCIAGNSMGAIIGALYASGHSPEEIEQVMLSMDWEEIMDDAPPREEEQFRRKRDDDIYLVKKYIGYEGGRLELPLGNIKGQKLDIELSRLTQRVSSVSDFDKLPIPFRAVATDIETGTAVVIGGGSLSQALRASMAIPGGFDAVEIDGKLLVDGLISNNIPVDVAREMGADIVIVVDVGTPLMKSSQIKSALHIIVQVSNIVSRRNAQDQLRTLTDKDLYLQPDLGELPVSDYGQVGTAIEIGEKTAKTFAPKLKQLTASVGTRTSPAAPEFEPPVITFVRIVSDTRIGGDVLQHPFQEHIGKPLDTVALEKSIRELYGWNIFENVRYELIEDGGRDGLLIHIREKFFGPNYLQIGMSLASDMDGDGTWNIGMSLLKTALNRRAGEFRFAGQIGESPLAMAEFYQPLDVGLRWFVSPQVLYDSRNFGVFEGDEEVQEFRVQRYGGSLSAGRVFGDWGEVRAGFVRYAGETELHVGAPDVSDDAFDIAEIYARLTYDTFDNRNFPHSGALARLEWKEAVDALGADEDYSQALLSADAAYTLGRTSLFSGVEFDYTADGEVAIQNRFRLGGFTRLSGFVQDALSGQNVLLLRGGFYHRIGTLDWLPAYAGMSVEYGNVYEDRDDISLATDKALLAASIFLGVDTLIGPLYLGYGHAEQGHDSLYLVLGRLF